MVGPRVAPASASPRGFGHFHSDKAAKSARNTPGPPGSRSIVGRVAEQELLQSVWDSRDAELLAIYGRRRVGKTHLIREFFEPRADVYFSVVGQKDASLATQLFHFQKELERALYGGSPLPQLKSWDQALSLLCDAVENHQLRYPQDRIVIFLDELPWLASPRSGLLQSMDYYWNA